MFRLNAISSDNFIKSVNIAKGDVESRVNADSKIPPTERLSNGAKEIIKSIKKTFYSFSNKINLKEGFFDIDCSGTAMLLLLLYAPENAKPILEYTKVARADDAKRKGYAQRPRVKEFYDFFKRVGTEAKKYNDGSLWKEIEDVKNIRSGDFIVYAFSPKVIEERVKKGKSTGHIIMAVGKPEFYKNKKIKQGDNNVEVKEYKIRIIESSPSEKIDDTKTSGKYISGLKGEGKQMLGLGEATILFGAEDNGNILYFKNKFGILYLFEKPSFRRFVVARPLLAK
jgi:hypothetical protein